MTPRMDEAVERLQAVEPAWIARANARQDTLTKPPGSLGRLENVAARLCAIQKTLAPTVGRARVVVFAGDHGITATQAVSPYPRDVTAQMIANFVAGGAAINALAGAVGVEVEVVDIGAAAPVPELASGAKTPLIRRRVAPGTADFTHGPAMTAEQVQSALDVGIERAHAAADEGIEVIALGEMGIGNTTVAAALTAALTGREPAQVVGPGTGASADMIRHKCQVISRALAFHSGAREPLDILRCVGGFELAGLCGLCLGAAARRIAVVSDGYIATAAAAVAVAAWPAVRGYVFSGHRSTEPGHRVLLDWLDLVPLIDLDLRLGEGTGAVLAIPMLRAAAAALREMATFDQAGVSGGESADASPGVES